MRTMARQGLGGRPMEPSDVRWWKRLRAAMGFIGWETVILIIIGAWAGFDHNHELLRHPAWHDFFLGGMVMATSMLLRIRFIETLYASPTVRVLNHLPVSGCDICRWARRDVFWRSLLTLPRMLAVAYAWHGFPALAHMGSEVVLTGMLLWIVMLASVILVPEALGFGVQAKHFWGAAVIIWLLLSAYAMFTMDGAKEYGHLPDWMVTLSETVSWLFPAKWARHAAWNPAPALLTLACLALGALRWIRMPAQVGAYYDTLASDTDVASDSETEDAAPIEVFSMAEPLPGAAMSVPGDAAASIRQIVAEEAAHVSQGWIEKLMLALMHGRDRMLAAMLTGRDPGWTHSWLRAWRLCLLLTAAGGLAAHLGGAWISPETAHIWTRLLLAGVILQHTFPTSNSIPFAMVSQPLGQHRMPHFAGLPITVHDLLRVSLRIILARTVGCLSLAIPIIAVHCFTLQSPGQIPMLAAVAIMAAACAIAWRPVLVCLRLHQSSRPVRSAFLGHLLSRILVWPLLLVMITTTVSSITGSFALLSLQMKNVSVPLLTLVVTAVIGRCIHAVFHSRIRAGKVDWLTKP